MALTTPLRSLAWLIGAGALIAACAPKPFIPPDDPTVPTVPLGADSLAGAPPGSAATPDPGALGPRVSRSLGQSGGVVVLYPRIIPSNQEAAIRDTARTVQGRLHHYVTQALPQRPVDLRPEPERVCPRATGCLGVTVGVLIVTNGVGCAVVALVSEPGKSPQRLVTWAGEVTVWKPAIPFRDPPEAAIRIRDFARCADLPVQLDRHRADIVSAIRAAAMPPR